MEHKDGVNGDLTKEFWTGVPWSDAWQDIQGPTDAPPDHYAPAVTRFKAVYDDHYLYIGAQLDASPDFATQAHFTHRNDPIYQQDSDFEVFVDVWNNNHNYKELEVNAWNTIWNLLLDRPYDDGGCEHSGRIAQPGDTRYYEVYQQATATEVLAGHVNDATGQGATWSIEVALAYSDLFATPSSSSPSPPLAPPKPGTFWRVNFSRVELQGHVNWTWQSQVVWNPARHRYQGQVNMHLPDAWGYFAFVAGTTPGDGGGDPDGGETLQHEEPTKEQGNTQPQQPQQPQEDDLSLSRTTTRTWTHRDPSWPLRITAMNLYYAQRYVREQTGRYAATMEELQEWIDPTLYRPIVVDLNTTTTGLAYTATLRETVDHQGQDDWSPEKHRSATITHQRLLTVAVAEPNKEEERADS